MDSLLHVAGASLPVAIGLLLLALSACGLLWARRGGEEMQRIASRYLEPLCTGCLVVVAVTTLARLAAGEVGMWLLPAFALTTLALGLLMAPDATPAAEVAPAQPPPPAVPETPAPPASLWAETVADDSAPRAGLWRRA